MSLRISPPSPLLPGSHPPSSQAEPEATAPAAASLARGGGCKESFGTLSQPERSLSILQVSLVAVLLTALPPSPPSSSR